MSSRNLAEVIRSRLRESVKNRVRLRDNNQCVRCGFRRKLSFHHLIPISDFIIGKAKGRVNCDANLVLLCQRCHVKVHRKVDCELGRFFRYIEGKEVKQKENENQCQKSQSST